VKKRLKKTIAGFFHRLPSLFGLLLVKNCDPRNSPYAQKSLADAEEELPSDRVLMIMRADR